MIPANFTDLVCSTVILQDIYIVNGKIKAKEKTKPPLVVTISMAHPEGLEPPISASATLRSIH